MSNKAWVINVRADTNDGDYVTEETEATQTEVDLLVSLLERVKWGIGSNFETQDCGDAQEEYDYTDEEWDFLSDFIPSSEHGIHTLERVEKYENVTRELLFG